MTVNRFCSSGLQAIAIGAEKIIDYTPRPNYLDRFADRIGAAMINMMGTSLGLEKPVLR